MTLMDHTTDSPTDWSVLAGSYDPRFSSTVNDQVRPVTVIAVADDPSQHIQISATCSVLEIAP
jgi:hypothetical protein